MWTIGKISLDRIKGSRMWTSASRLSMEPFLSGLVKRQASKHSFLRIHLLSSFHTMLQSYRLSLFWNVDIVSGFQLLFVCFHFFNLRYNSHKWTVYVRSANNEDLSVIVKRVVFQLHPSFQNPTRVVEQQPFELSESGWGEFEIAITLYFHSDVCEKRLDL